MDWSMSCRPSRVGGWRNANKVNGWCFTRTSHAQRLEHSSGVSLELLTKFNAHSVMVTWSHLGETPLLGVSCGRDAWNTRGCNLASIYVQTLSIYSIRLNCNSVNNHWVNKLFNSIPIRKIWSYFRIWISYLFFHPCDDPPSRVNIKVET